MKQLSALVLLGALVGYLLYPSAAIPQQRGDLYGAAALQRLEQAFKTTGVISFPNYAAAHVTCNAANLGVHYYDTTANEARVCAGAVPGWLTLGGAGLTVGTANTIPKWNAVPDDLVDSVFTDDGTGAYLADDIELWFGAVPDASLAWDSVSDYLHADVGGYIVLDANPTVPVGDTMVDFQSNGSQVLTLSDRPAAGAGGVLLELHRTLNIMNGADTVIGFQVDLTSADHVGGPNTNNFFGVAVDDIVNDDDTVEWAFASDSGWDADLWNINGDLYVGSSTQIFSVLDNTLGQIFTVDSSHAAGGSNTWVEIDANLAIMDAAGGDIARGLFVDITNANHTGGTVYGVDVDTIVGDAQAAEVAVNIGAGWDYTFMWPGGNADQSITFYNTNDSDVAFQINGDSSAPSTGWFVMTNPAPQNGTSADMLHLDYDVPVMAGSDTNRGIYIDPTDENHSGSSNFLYALDIDGITQDPDATETAINIGAGWDRGIHLDDGSATDDNLVFGNGADAQIFWADGSSLLSFDADTTSAGGFIFYQHNDGTTEHRGSGGVGSFIYDSYNASNTGVDILDLQVLAVRATNGNDVINMLLLDWDETDWATATEEWNAILIDDMTQDAQGLYYGVHVGTGPDAALYSEGVAHANLAAVANGSMIFCTDCDPATTPCTAVGAQTGAFAFRVNGQWDCPW